MRITFQRILVILTLFTASLQAKQADLNPKDTLKLANEMMELHASQRQLDPEIMKRTFKNYLEELDPTKTYFIESDIDQWLNPSPEFLDKSIAEYKKADFSQFGVILDVMDKAIERRHQIQKEINMAELPAKVDAAQFKDMQWVKTTEELKERLIKIRALQAETSAKLNDDIKEKSMERIFKHESKQEEKMLTTDPREREKFILTEVLKATASALDTHTKYFTPDEAKQFMIDVQQRLFGIGAQLRDDIVGFTVVKIIEGGPAQKGGELKAKDRIIAVNGEPIVGMDIVDGVELIRGEKDTPVVLTVIREEGEGSDKKEKKLDITILRGEVVFQEGRLESSHEPYGDGVIAYLKLHTFYQDSDSSSTGDILKEFEKIKTEHPINGVVLDLRYNTGGLLNQAVSVAGLFINKGIVVSIKENTGQVQHLRNLESKTMWDGPLIVLVNRLSASASEIVAQALQDYGRAIIVGDDHTFGKGSFQTFTLNSQTEVVNPEGEFKVTRGRYYTVSGKTPQLTGVLADIVVPGPFSQAEIGEKFGKYPLEGDLLPPNFEDDLSDIPYAQRDKVRMLYKFDLQKQIKKYTQFLPRLKENSTYRIEHNKNYQAFLKEVAKKEPEDTEEEQEQFGQNDLQLTETYNIMKDLILLETTK